MFSPPGKRLIPFSWNASVLAWMKCRTRFGVCASFPQDPAWAVITAESFSTAPLQLATICRAPCLHYYRQLRNRGGKVEAQALSLLLKKRKTFILPICCFCSVSRMNVYVLMETSAKPPPHPPTPPSPSSTLQSRMETGGSLHYAKFLSKGPFGFLPFILNGGGGLVSIRRLKRGW